MEELKNPIWAALHSAQAHFARAVGAARCYPADVAPFCAVAADGVALTEQQLATLDGEYYFLGPMPALPAGWRLQAMSGVLQMVYQGGPVTLPEAADIEVLQTDDPAMQALTALAFPGYFRAQTGRMGRYAGIHRDGKLVSMAGERMDLGHLREVSAVCTDPAFIGQGMARRLVQFIMWGMQQQGVRPLLHVGAANARAQALYRDMGFVATRELAHARLLRA
jgi:ribosomal protein S18 acetylase RimI-like enzyme